MWFVVKRRDARPDAAVWPGRRLLAVLDAMAWPAIGMALVMRLPARGGVVGPVLLALLMIVAARRLRRAIWLNHRYRFTTWRWGRAALACLVFGLLLRWVLRL